MVNPPNFGEGYGSTGFGITPEEQKALDSIDWAPALRHANEVYDRMVSALRIPDRNARQKECRKVMDELDEMVKKNRDFADLQKLIKGGAPGPDIGKQIGKEITNVLLGLLLPALHRLHDSFDRAQQVERNLHVAFALAAHRKDTGKYPAKLADLAPKYLATVPNDLFAGKDLIYKPSEKGYLFYSVGANGKDDDGRGNDDDPPGDDLGVKMPLPALLARKK